MKKNSKRNSKNLIPKTRLLIIFLFILLFTLLISFLSYFIMKNEEKKKEEVQKPKVEKYQDKELVEYFDKKAFPKENNFEEITEEFHKSIDEKPLETLQKQESSKKEEIQKPKKTEKEEAKDKATFSKKDKYIYDKKTKPKLAIVIDDVSTKKQKNDILKVGYKITMSFLPPTKDHKNSAKIALDLPFYMIHFPLQASKAFKGAESSTLTIQDTYETIEKRVEQLRKWYPNTIYTNNHTGSVFTANDKAMDNLFKALVKYNFIFMDSRTTPKSVVKKYAQKYNMPYIVRNTFIDNEKDFSYIQNQLQKAIKKAKKNGYAIAIGHPYSITIEVLRKSKHLLKGIELIYINELPYL